MVELLHEMVLSNIEKHPDNIAIVDRRKKITYSELQKNVNNFYNILCTLNVKKGDRIGILCKKSVEVIVAILAVLKAGAAFVPINIESEIDEISYIIQDCGLKILFADDSVKKILDKDSIIDKNFSTIIMTNTSNKYYSSIYKIVDSSEAIDEDSKEICKIIGNDLAYIYYTSGSTGKAKGVMISHSSIVFEVKFRRAALQYDSKSITLSLCALQFDPVINEIFCTLSVGGKLVLIPDNNSIILFKNFQRIIKKENITIFFCVPSFLNILFRNIKIVKKDLKDLKYIVFGAGMCSPKLIQSLSVELPETKFVHGYGLTETSVTACSYTINNPWDISYESYPIGKPINGTEFYIMDNNKLIEHGVGELVIRGPHLMKGYWKKPDETSKVLRLNPIFPEQNEKVLFTGDMVRIEKNGDLIYVGRKDEQIKCAGHRIELGEVEMLIEQFAGVRQACVVALPDTELGNKMVAFIVLNNNTTLGDVKVYCRNNLLSYKIPQKFVEVKELPLNSNGKVDKNRLRNILI